MGYACPVCEAPEADGEHLANHLAFTAMLHGGDHEAWLDGHVPDWDGLDPDALAAEVVEFADAVDHDTVFEDTTGGRPDVRQGPGAIPPEDLDPEARRMLEEARELTRERLGIDETEE